MQFSQLVEDIKGGNPAYKHFIVQSNNRFFITFTDSASCAPYDAIAL